MLQADASTEAGKCICDAASAGPYCDFCEVPGKCAACGGITRQQDGVCGELVASCSDIRPLMLIQQYKWEKGRSCTTEQDMCMGRSIGKGYRKVAAS